MVRLQGAAQVSAAEAWGPGGEWAAVIMWTGVLTSCLVCMCGVVCSFSNLNSWVRWRLLYQTLTLGLLRDLQSRLVLQMSLMKISSTGLRVCVRLPLPLPHPLLWMSFIQKCTAEVRSTRMFIRSLTTAIVQAAVTGKYSQQGLTNLLCWSYCTCL